MREKIEDVFDAWQEASYKLDEATRIFRARSCDMLNEMKDMTVADAYKMNLIRINFKSTLPRNVIQNALEI